MRHEHKHSQIPCCDSAQDAWSDYYISAAGALSESYGMTGRAAARDAIRLYAEMLGRERREFLVKHGRKPNLYNIFLHGGPLPAGCRTRKEPPGAHPATSTTPLPSSADPRPPRILGSAMA